MQCVYFLVIGFIITVKCNVVSRQNITQIRVEEKGNFDDENTKILNTENTSTTENVMKIEYAEFKNYTVPGQINSDLLFLNDLFISINKLNWTEEEQPCLDQVRRMLYGLQNFTLWAVWDWEAQTHEFPGAIFGGNYQLGNFDQCMSAPWANTHPELKTKYCIVDVELERTDKDIKTKLNEPLDPYQSAADFIQNRPLHTRELNHIKWGACVPSSCQTKSIEKLMAVMLARSHLSTAGMKANIETTEECQTYDYKLSTKDDALFFSFLGLVAALLAIAIICTFLNQIKSLKPESFSTGLIKAFCLRENARSLLSVKKEDVEVLYGIRFLSICFVVLIHQIGIYNSGPLSDVYTTDQVRVKYSFLGMFILNIDLVVDTFFFMSGFLTITYLANNKRLPNPIIMILVRYVRLMAALSVVMFFYVAAFPYTVSGPLSVMSAEFGTASCRQNWWINLLMLNNYYDSEHICILPSWYIPCDFHFFVVTVLIYCVYKKLPRLGLFCGVVIAIAAIVTPGVINYMNGYDAIMLFTYGFVVDTRANNHFNAMYIKSHARYGAYLVGFVAGYIYTSYRSEDKQKIITKKWSIIGSIIALALMLILMISGSTFVWREYHPLEVAVYAALDRPGWAVAIALLVLCCSLGSVPLIKGFLSWYPWAPLSRLAYGIYLVHTAIITRNVFSARNPEHNGFFFMIITTTGVTVWSGLAALALWLLVEAPANKLLALCLRSQLQKFKDKQKESNSYEVTNMTASNGHSQDSVPTVRFSSKM